MSGSKVLVAGASIAGPALAHWLVRRGADVTVVERAPGLRPDGQAVDARGLAKEVIRRMGLDAAVWAARTDTAGAYTVDVDGNVLETFRADDHGGDGYISEVEILRGDREQHNDRISAFEQTRQHWKPRRSCSSFCGCRTDDGRALRWIIDHRYMPDALQDNVFRAGDPSSRNRSVHRRRENSILLRPGQRDRTRKRLQGCNTLACSEKVSGGRAVDQVPNDA